MKPWFDVPVFNWLGGQLTAIDVGQYIRSAQQDFPEARAMRTARSLRYARAIASPNFTLTATSAARCRNARIAGTQVLLKGGQGWDDDLFLTVRSL